MRKYLSLTKVLLKSGMGMTDGSSKKWFKLLIYGVLAVCFLPMLILLYAMIDSMLPAYAMLGQAGSILGTMMFLASFLIFIFSIFMIPSIFYFSSDTDLLLALPLKPEQIIGSKFTTVLIYEYLFSLGVLLPTYLAYLNFTGMSVSFVLYGILIIFLLPVYPLVLSTILTILLMRFVPFFKNRDRFNMISGILLLVFALGFSFASNSFTGTGSEKELLEMMLAGNNSMLDMFMKAFPMIPFFSRALADGSILDFLIGVGICAIALILLLTVGKYLYFKGAIGNSESSSTHKALNEAQFNKSTKQGSKIWTYAKKDFKLLIRTPVFFINCISSAVVFPALLILLPLLGSTADVSSLDLSKLIPMLEGMENFPVYVIMIGLGLGFMLGLFNMISATAISREGQNYVVMKYLPISYGDQIHAKILCGIIVGIITIILTIVPLMFIIPINPLYYLIIFLCSVVTTILGNELCVLVDLAKPKLVWEQEAAAVKQNLGAFVSMMGGMALCVIIIGSCFIIPSEFLWIMAGAFVIISVILCVVMNSVTAKYAEKAMLKL